MCSVNIPAEYHPHLMWIHQESLGDLQESKWLQNVIDCFAEELCAIQSDIDASWRSLSLNCLMVRTFNSMPYNDQVEIMKKVIARTNPGHKKMNANGFLQFY